MAEKLDSYRFKKHRYPWDQWLEGSIWKLQRGVDFTSTLETFRSLAHKTARNKGLKIHTAVEYGDNGEEYMVVQTCEG